MDFVAFRQRAKTVKSEQDGFSLVALAEKKGTPALREWLRTGGLRWAETQSWHFMVAPMFLARYPSFAEHNPTRETALIWHDNSELLDLAAKRGLNVNSWGGDLFLKALPHWESVKWLSEQTDIVPKIMAVPADDDSWEVVRKYPDFCIKSLIKLRCSKPLARIAQSLKGLPYYTRNVIRHEVIPREYCLADGGALLRALLWNPRARKNMLRLLMKKSRLTSSDLLSVGLEPCFDNGLI